MNPDLPERVAKSIDRFTGRAWVLPKLLEWWDKSDARLFLLTGGPGTGKSMILAWLAGFGPVPEEQTARAQLKLVREAVKAAHFCRASSRNISPQAFAESIANQLTNSVTGFADALAATLAERVSIVGTAQASTAASGSNLAGVSIGRIDLGTLGDELSFDRAFTQPLKKLYADGHSEPMLLLVDALDEAQTYTGQVTLPDLLSRLVDLPAGVRIVATTRDEPRVLKFFRAVEPFDLIKDADPNVDDVRTYAEGRLAKLSGIEEAKRNDFAQLLARQANGVFLYAAMVLDELLERPPADLPALDTYVLPEGLGGLYHNFLIRELGKDEPHWFDLYEPLLGLIAVAQGDGLTTEQLTDMVGKDIRAALRACKQYLNGELPAGPFRPFHKSFADFLLDDPDNSDFHIDSVAMHRRIAEHYWRYHEDWSKCHRYGLKYLALHLAAGGSRDHLFELVADPKWVAAKQITFHDPVVLLDDLYRAISVARCEAPPAVLALIRAAAISGHLIGVAPPLIVDVLARAGQLRRARLLAENTAFPLDRCASLSWLAQRAHEQGDVELANRSLEGALEAASRVTGSYRAMSASFCVDAALGLGQVDRARDHAREAVNIASDALSRLSESQRFRDNAHSIFWTLRAVRAAFGNDGPADAQQLVLRYDRRVWNLDLQIAAMAGDLSFLERELQAHRSVEWTPSVRSNVALALANAGQVKWARELCIGGGAGNDFGDNAKRMAWACALCEEFDRAFEIAERISHPEEAMRALQRIQQVAQAMANTAAVHRAAEFAKQVLVRAASIEQTHRTEKRRRATGLVRTQERMAVKSVPTATVGPADRWRLEIWAAHLLSIAGQSQEALALAESICGRNIASVEANSLCYPTSFSAGRRRHVVPSDSIDVAAFRRELASVTDRRELLSVCKTCERLAELTGLSAWIEMRKALSAMADPAELNNAGPWLDAMAAAARLGRAEVGVVVDLLVFVEDQDRLLVNKADLTASLEEGDRVLALSNR